MTSNISATALKKIRKKYNLSSNSSLSASQFRELQGMGQNNGSSGRQVGTKGKNSASMSRRQIFSFSFKYELLVQNENTLIITLTGRHLSKNQYDRLPEFDRKNKSSKYHYKKAFKTASEECRLMQKSLFDKLKKEKITPLGLATVHFTFYNHRSRDHDNNGSDTIKPFQDTFTALGLIVDDSREYLIPEREPDEVIVKRTEPYKVVAVLKLK